MNPYYYEPVIEEATGAASAVGVMLVFWIIYFVFMLFMLALAVAGYVLGSFGMYSIAKRRGIKNPWLSWIPIGSSWILGSISDQYQYVTKGKISNRRKILLGLDVATLVSVTLFFVLYIIIIFAMMIAFAFFPNGAVVVPFVFLIVVFALVFAMSAVSIAVMIFTYLAYYDLFQSCNPDNAVLFLVLGIFVSYAHPVLIFINRNKDLGMPALKTDEEATDVVDVPEE